MCLSAANAADRGKGMVINMDEKKAAQVEKLEKESADLMQKIREETEIKKKRKLIAEKIGRAHV